MNPEEIPNEWLDEMDRLASDATPWPWVNPDGYCVRHPDRDNWRTVCQTWKSGQSVEQGVHDMEFIAAARTAVPELIAEVRRLRKENAWLRNIDDRETIRRMAEECGP